jgi:glutamate racemase
LADVMGRDVVLVSSADETAFEVRRRLEELGLARSPTAGAGPAPTFLTTGDVAWFTDLGSRLLGPELADAALISWE